MIIGLLLWVVLHLFKRFSPRVRYDLSVIFGQDIPKGTLAILIILGLVIFSFLYPELNNFIGRELSVNYMKNPLMSENGIKEILKTIEQSGVKVNSICADFFMEAPLHSNDDNVRSKSIEVLNKLIKCASIIGASDIVIPCVDQSSLKTDRDKKRFELSLSKLLKEANKHKINLALETDLGPEEFKVLIERFDNNYITVNYDTGNSASLGYDIDEEIPTPKPLLIFALSRLKP